MINIKSADGFKRRLTDITCTGCHQTRAIGGFHLMGEDPYRWSEQSSAMVPVYPGNAVVVPASAHFFADLERRRAVLDLVAAGQNPDYSTGYSSRPQANVPGLHSDGEGIYNGWGSHCYHGSDPSFANWTCAAGLRCVTLHQSPLDEGMGVCVSRTGKQVGDPLESGSVKLLGGDWYTDKYVGGTTFNVPTGKDFVSSRQSGGFPGGSLRLASCDPTLMHQFPEARCGSLPAASGGFNACLFQPNMSFEDCLRQHSAPVGLRGCSRLNACRDDYICVQSLDPALEDAGVCVPPYFLFQFRVDGHPVNFN